MHIGPYAHVAALGTPLDRFYMPTVYSAAEREGFIQQALAAGISQSDINTFLQYNPGDEHRIIDALLNVRREDYTAANPQTAPVLQPRAASGELIAPERQDAQLYATYQRSTGIVPTNATSGPPGAYGYASAPQLNGYLPGGGPSAGAGFAGSGSLFGLDLTTIAILAAMGFAAYYFLVKK